MDIGECPQDEASPKAVPKTQLYYIDFTCYNRRCTGFFFIREDLKVRSFLWELTDCYTTIVHYCALYEPVTVVDGIPEPVLKSDIHVITYGLYNEYFKFYSFQSDPDRAKGDAKYKIHISIEIMDITRYKRAARKIFDKPFKFQLKYSKPYFNEL